MLREKKEFDMQVAKARAIRLAGIHGPFVRFEGEGNEGKKDALDEAIKTGEEAAKTPEEQSAIDDARKAEQQLEQEQSNTRRANEAATQAQSALETANSENESLQEQLDDALAKASVAGITEVELNEDDYETATDKVLVKAIKNIEARQEAKDKEIAELKKKATAYEANAAKKEATEAGNAAYEELLTDLDGEYGADCRNEAVVAFNQLRTDGKIPQGRPAKATRAMEACYKAAKKAKDKAKDESKKLNLDLDTGGGGGSAIDLKGVEIKEGSLDDVDAQIAKTEIGARKI